MTIGSGNEGMKLDTSFLESHIYVGLGSRAVYPRCSKSPGTIRAVLTQSTESRIGIGLGGGKTCTLNMTAG